MDLGHWEFPHEFDTKDWFGFIYRIVELNTGREYLGKKQFYSNLTKAIKGKKIENIIKKNQIGVIIQVPVLNLTNL